MVNGGVYYQADAPFGGYKQSGIGREMGAGGLCRISGNQNYRHRPMKDLSDNAYFVTRQRGDGPIGWPSMKDLSGNTYIVTGASKGFGRAITEALLAAGANVRPGGPQ